MIVASIVNIKGVEGQSNKEEMPSLAELGAITKWMSDPPPKAPMKPTLQDRHHRYCHPEHQDYPDFCGNLEALRVEDRSNTFDYRPNIDFMAQNCMGLNYHWPAKITLPSITMSLSSDNNVDVQKLRKSAPNGCIVVLIGAKYLHRINVIVSVVDYITSQLAIRLVTYFGEKTEVMPVVELDKAPAIVRDCTYKVHPDAVHC